ncbi:mRNA cap guanine-N7 methyltransferase [Onygenales sp. PD_40]|nr:mRNA cap guanine-N7 methyltransferase [Onygenales sp. PD_40]KAK2781324.1 mRNA cap guanine-N7 methyltransferase [Onygenales sp. PD_12]KAK2784176.1 mRNA cap guanine-N7 methyltransferase [Emmonsiellopsis sp. PD_33]KAK2805735.1 mRNA cap guanine-N7 methyltransferase [Onygenales sp. PD_10]
MADRAPDPRRRASITMYDPARDTYTVSDESPPKRSRAHGPGQEEQVEESPSLGSTSRGAIEGGTRPERSLNSLHETPPSLSSHSPHRQRPANSSTSVAMGSNTPEIKPSQNGHSESPEGLNKSNISSNDKKRSLPEDEPHPEKPKPAPEQQPLSKRKRQEERLQKNRKRGKAPPSAYSRRDRSPTPPRRSHSPDQRSPGFRHRDPLARRTRSPSPIRRSPSPDAAPRQRKRPGGGARIAAANLEAIRRRQEERERQREEDAKADLRDRGVHDVVRQHYNAVPERGREWRKTDSRIKGLRSFNNWVKSTIIQKFSPDEEFLSRANGKGWAGAEPVEEKRLLVVDLGCGKGGDLGKWQQAPQPVDLYVGLDPAEISIEQARERYISMKSGRGRMARRGHPLFHGEFYPKDCFGEWVGNVPIIQRVGIDGSVGPDGNNMMASRWGGGGFDIVVSMFSMHYAFETEEKARQMLHNVAGLLKKGGRFIGVGPNSDVLSAKVEEFHEKRKKREAEAEAAKRDAGEKEDGEVEDSSPTVPEWGNSIYRVRFPGDTPEDGIFRPAFGWKYSYFMEEAVEEIPEYVVPWEAFRALTQDYNLELQYRKPFLDIWKEEKDDPILGPLSERMGVRERGGGPLLVSDEELEAASFYHAFCFYKV